MNCVLHVYQLIYDSPLSAKDPRLQPQHSCKLIGSLDLPGCWGPRAAALRSSAPAGICRSGKASAGQGRGGLLCPAVTALQAPTPGRDVEQLISEMAQWPWQSWTVEDTSAFWASPAAAAPVGGSVPLTLAA